MSEKIPTPKPFTERLAELDAQVSDSLEIPESSETSPELQEALRFMEKSFGYDFGEQVIVERSSGDKEDDWHIDKMSFGADGTKYLDVRKKGLDEDGKILVKTVTLDTLQSWQDHSDYEEVIDTPEYSEPSDIDNETAAQDHENLLRTHALRQSAAEKTLNTIQAIEGVAHGVQNIRSAIKKGRLSATRTRAQRRFERHSLKAETSMFAFRRRKFAAKAAQSKNRLDSANRNLNNHNTAVDERQQQRDGVSNERQELLDKKREFLRQKTSFARERRTRRREKWEMHLTLDGRRQEELRAKRRDQLPIDKLRQELFARYYEPQAA